MKKRLTLSCNYNQTNMNCIIIEDEPRAIKHLEHQLKLTGHEITVQTRLDSIDTTVAWLKSNETHLIFLDIELADGLSFEIFDHVQVKTPVIFTTSYNQYITKAFDVNSISYLLKPVNLEQLKSALNKYDFLYPIRELAINEKVSNLNQGYQKRFMVQTGGLIKTIPVENVAYFRIQNKRFLTITCKDRQQYLLDGTMELLEQRLDPEIFFRINRQFIVRIDAISKMHRMGKGRIKIEVSPDTNDDMIISSEKAPEFRSWLNI
jgi:two-component system, LytTR family, response regulator LytT